MYADIIKEATGCSDTEAAEIEEIMRSEIFHSTLDWQTRAELMEAARLALAVLRLQDSEGTHPMPPG